MHWESGWHVSAPKGSCCIHVHVLVTWVSPESEFTGAIANAPVKSGDLGELKKEYDVSRPVSSISHPLEGLLPGIF